MNPWQQETKAEREKREAEEFTKRTENTTVKILVGMVLLVLISFTLIGHFNSVSKDENQAGDKTQTQDVSRETSNTDSGYDISNIHSQYLESGAYVSGLNGKQIDILVKVLRIEGWTCDSVTRARTALTELNTWYVTCNNYNYSYKIQDQGGNMVVIYQN